MSGDSGEDTPRITHLSTEYTDSSIDLATAMGHLAMMLSRDPATADMGESRHAHHLHVFSLSMAQRFRRWQSGDAIDAERKHSQVLQLELLKQLAKLFQDEHPRIPLPPHKK